MIKILLVDDEPSILSVLATLLRQQEYEVKPLGNGADAVDLIKEEKFDLVLTDIRMAPVDGLKVLKAMQEIQPQTPVILLTGYGSVQTAVEAMKGGAFDYVTKPFKVDELLLTVKRALEYHNAMLENSVLKNQLEAKYRLNNIVATSESMRKVCDMVERIAPTNATVLVRGESGTGKELVAKAIHLYSNRSDKKFIAVNCAAMPEALLESEMFGHVKGSFTGASFDKKGLFKVADGGTIFLDEISSMPLSVQAKFLRVLQDKQIRRVGGTESTEVDVRVIAACNDSLEMKIKAGEFREDLYYRISVIPIVIEPLRDRREDILPLVSYFIQKEKKKGDETPTMDKLAQLTLEKYDWPGNVRELENAIRHALAFSTDNNIKREMLPSKILEATRDLSSTASLDAEKDSDRGKSLKAFLKKKERDYVSEVIASMDGDMNKAARKLNISVAALNRKLKGEDVKNENKSGFTLVELLIVVMVIGILVSIAVPVAFNARKEARIANARKGVAVIATAIENFFQEYGRLPKGNDDEDIIKALTGDDSTENPRELPFLEVKGSQFVDWEGEHLDPWGSQYRIYLDNDDGEYDRRISVENVTVSNKMAVVVSPGSDKRMRTKDDILSTAVPENWVK